MPVSQVGGPATRSSVVLWWKPRPAGQRWVVDCQTSESPLQVKIGEQIVQTFAQGNPLFVYESSGGEARLEISGDPSVQLAANWTFYGCVVTALQ